jgi:hypothetical protein
VKISRYPGKDEFVKQGYKTILAYQAIFCPEAHPAENDCIEADDYFCAAHGNAERRFGSCL